MKKLIVLFILIISYSSATATNYHVSPTGSDANDGLTTGTAWASINNGDQNAILAAGDTVFIQSGTYNLSATVIFDQSGVDGSPIVYQGDDLSSVIFDGAGNNFILFELNGDYLEFSSMTLTNSTDNGFEIGGTNNFIHHCLITDIGTYGAYLTAGAANNKFYNNTFFRASNIAIYPVNSIKTTRIINNIIVFGTNGIWAASDNIAANNNIWQVSSPYVGGVADSAGGISADPLFTDTTAGDFSLNSTSPCIDSGCVIGYPFYGSAPDIGAFEYNPSISTNYYVSTTGNDLNDGLTPATAWASIDNGDFTKTNVLVPGDTVFVIEGAYVYEGVYIFQSNGQAGLPITYTPYLGARVTLEANLTNNIILTLEGTNTIFDGFIVKRTQENGIYIKADSCQIKNCLIRNIGKIAVWVEGSDCLFYNNRIKNPGEEGFKNEGSGDYNLYYNNVIVECGTNGIELKSNTCRAINNIVTDCNDGIRGGSSEHASFNCVWNNTASNYTGGVVDSAGGISADPMFVDQSTANFDLRWGSPCIDAGLDVGIPYLRSAPDIGFEEFHDPEVFYVSTSGDNANNGLSPDSAWLTIDYGESIGQIGAGDTVSIAAGKYIVTEIILQANGTDSLPITYFGAGMDSTIIGGSSVTLALVAMHGSHTKFSNMQVSDGQWDGFWITGDSSVVSECYISNMVADGIDIGGFDSTATGIQVLKNIVSTCGESGIENDATVTNTKIYGNTVYNNSSPAILLNEASGTARVFNNIVAFNTVAGIIGNWENRCAFNNVYDDWYDGGVYDSAGGISEDPFFVDTATGNFNLNSKSTSIDAGLDLGYPFLGLAPDLGALEYTNQAPNFIIVDSQIVDENQNLNFTIIAGDPDGTIPTLTAENLPVNATFIDNGDSTGTFDFNPDYTQAGIYDVSFIASDGIFADTMIVTISVTHVNQPVTLAAIGPQTVEEGQNLNLIINASDADGTIPTIDIKNIPLNATFIDNNDGTGTFDFTPAYDQEGLDSMLVIATDGELADSEWVMVTVTPAPVSYIEISPSTNIVEALDSFLYVADGFDAGSTFVKILTDSVSWATDDPGGSVSATGMYTAGAGLGNYTIDIAYNAMFDTVDVEVISNGLVSYVQIEYLDGSLVSDTVLTTDNDSTVLYCRAYDIGDVLIGDVAVSWEIIDGNIGSIPAALKENVTLIINSVDSARITVLHSLGAADTTGLITTVSGIPVTVVIEPDTATISADSTVAFTFIGYDEDNNETNFGIVPTWSVTGGIGTIDGSGEFTPTTAGEGTVVMTSGGLADTTGTITVLPGVLDYLIIDPQQALLSIDDSLHFTVEGYDSDGNAADKGEISWAVLGSAGTIDSTGLLIAQSIGYCRIIATSSIGGIADTTDFIEIQSLVISEYPLGNIEVRPNELFSPILAFSLENFYDDDKAIQGVIIRDTSYGHGTAEEIASAIDSITLYCDENDDGYFDAGDIRIASSGYNSGSNLMVFSPYTIPAYTEKRFFLSISSNQYVHDGDSLDVYLNPSVDIFIEDGTIVRGSNYLNSLGYGIINGLIAEQIDLISVGDSIITIFDSTYNILTVDLPRNGYHEDTLSSFSVINLGTATLMDIDSLCLHVDDGDNIYDIANDSSLGSLIYTGDRWEISGLNYALPELSNRFYIKAGVNEYPTNNATLIMTVPQNGIEMVSSNDGPYDQIPEPIDTITIMTNEQLSVSTIHVSGGEIYPGESTPPLLHIALHNSYAAPISFDSLKFSFDGIDPDGGTQAELDSQLTAVKLYRKSGINYDQIGAADSLIAQTIITNGNALFSTTGLTIPGNGGRVVLSIAADLDILTAKDENTVSFSVIDSSSIYTNVPVNINGSFPLQNDEPFVINSFPTAAVTVNPVTAKTIFGGQRSELVLDITLPSNGYAADFLSTIQVQNIGSQDDVDAVSAVKLWTDAGTDGFTADDIVLGSFTRNIGFWSLTGLNTPIPVNGKRFFLTIDIYDKNFNGGTIQYIIPEGGCTYTSGMIGPDDTIIQNPQPHVVFPSDRITVISIPDAGEVIPPGLKDASVLTFALYNGYSDRNQTLRSVSLTNSNISAASQSYSDYELGFVSIYHNSSGVEVTDSETPVASGRFINGKMVLSGLNVSLPSEEITYFYVLSDFPLAQIDSDSLAVTIENSADFVFEEDVNINGVLPLTRGSYLVVDGSIKAQYTQYPVAPITVSPGDTSIVVFAFAPAFNGEVTDYLDSLMIQNAGDADSSDIDRLELWLDLNDDNVWQSADSLIGEFVYTTGQWEIGSLNMLIDSLPPTLFVTTDIAIDATPDRTFNAVLPLMGSNYQSANDGPSDAPLSGDHTFSISSSLLRVENITVKNRYSIGETIEIRFTATNLSAGPLTNVVGQIYTISDSSAVTPDSAVNTPVTLNSGENSEFVYYYTADSAASIVWQLMAIAQDANDTSAVISTPSMQIQFSPDNVPVVLINSMPTSVTKGQTNVFPLSLKISHPENNPAAAAIRLDSLFLTVENSTGQLQLASDIFDRIVLTAGYANLEIIETVPAQSVIPLYFDTPVIIEADDEQNFSLLVDIDSSAVAANFVLSLSSALSIPIVDDNTDLQVTVDSTTIFPLKTASCRIDSPSYEMGLSFNPIINANANFGQNSFKMIELKLNHPGAASSSQIQLSSVSFEILDQFDTPLPISSVFDKLQIRKQFLVIAELSNELDTNFVDIELSSPVTLNPGEIDSIIISGDIKPDASVSSFKLRIADSTAFIVRDLSSGSEITVISDIDTLITTSLFPIVTSTANLKFAAESPEFCIDTTGPPSVIAGQDSVNLADITIVYPYTSAYSAVSLKSLELYILDSLQSPLDPTQLFDKIGYIINNGIVEYQAFVKLSSGAAVFEFDTDGYLINPGDSLSISLIGDIEADAGYDHYVYKINNASAIHFADQTDTLNTPELQFMFGCDNSFPIQSSVTSVISPAGRPVLETDLSHLVNTFGGEANVELFSGKIHYTQEIQQGNLRLNSLLGVMSKRYANSFTQETVSTVFDNIRLLLEDTEIAIDSSLLADTVLLIPESLVSISNGSIINLSIIGDIRADAPVGNYRFEFSDSSLFSFEDIQLSTMLYPLLMSGSYPLYSNELSVSVTDLEESFVNYPNPFLNETNIVFVLTEDGYVDIELFTITGESVMKLVDNEFRSTGSYDTDKWYGRNAKDLQVMPGTYFCRLTVRYNSGSQETVMRKISLVR